MLAGDLLVSFHTSTRLTQIPIRNSVIIIKFIFLIVIFLDAITLVLLGDCAGTMEARPNVLFFVWYGLIFLNIPLTRKNNTHLLCN